MDTLSFNFTVARPNKKNNISKGETLKASDFIAWTFEEEVLEWCNRNQGGAKISIASF